MRTLLTTIPLDVLGPFGWPRFEGTATPLPEMPGVYLMTVPYQDGFLPYGVGITRRTVRKRFVEHTRSYMNGEYNVLELKSAQRGVREVYWKGWGWSPEKRTAFETLRESIESAARAQMLATKIFVLETGTSPRMLERLEAAIANQYYRQSDTLFDRGMLRMPRWTTEEPLIAQFSQVSIIVGLPETLAF